MLDPDFKARMDEIRKNAQENNAALKNARQEVERSLAELDSQIDYLADMQAILASQRDELRSQMGKPSLENAMRRRRQPHGALINAYTAALKGNTEGLRSSEVVDWINTNMKEINTGSVAAVLSKGVTDGRLMKDKLGRYTLT